MASDSNEAHDFGLHDSRVSFAVLGKQVVGAFTDLLRSSFRDHLPDNDCDALGYEVERFHTWASSIGLIHLGHSSLDYHLRDARKLATYIGKLLLDLCQALRLCKYLPSGRRMNAY